MDATERPRRTEPLPVQVPPPSEEEDVREAQDRLRAAQRRLRRLTARVWLIQQHAGGPPRDR
jgi:hypothetical protein